MAKYFSSLFFILSIILSAVLTYVFSRSAHRLDLSMYGYLSLNTIVQTTALFMWVKNSTIKNKVFSVIQHTISDYSYGIYLVHVIVIDILFSYGVFWTMAYPLISLPFLALLILISSFLIIFSLRKIPFGNYISG
jgi:surface polysaccharide O-acyltransferase-like enzyme